MNTIEQLTIDYFQAFSDKDIKKLKSMFSDSIHLVDWEVDIKGIDAVLNFNKKLFDQVNYIKVNPIITATTENTSLSKIKVEVDSIVLKVVDIITFEKDKIIKIEAFKQ